MEINKINAYRAEIMGVATLMVYLGHIIFFGRRTVDFGPFYALRFGYSGVDVFLFLSGIGLYYSMQKNSVADFYKHRAYRLIPTLLLSMATYCLLVFKLDLNIINPMFWYRMFWFVGFIMVAYALFPYIHRFVNSKRGGAFLLLAIAISIALFVMLYFKKAGWSNSYSCAITRIPIFALGVAFAASRAKWLTTKNVIILGIIGLCLIYLYTLYCKNADFINLNAHYAMFFTTPVVIWCLTRILPVVHPKVRRAFAWLGTLSLQVYLVQIILMQRYFVGLINRTNIYVASFVMFAAILLISIAIDKAHKLIVKRIQGAK